MKIHISARLTFTVTGVTSVLGIISVVVEEQGISLSAVLGILVVMTAVGLLVHSLMLIFSRGTVEERHIFVKGRSREFSRTYAPREGERFVISRREVHLEREDGTLVPTTVRKWFTARREWRRIERMFPTID